MEATSEASALQTDDVRKRNIFGKFIVQSLHNNLLYQSHLYTCSFIHPNPQSIES